MEVTDGTGEDRTFRVNFSIEGVAKLRENVKEKLKEYMGDYTDDTLVEYVIVLLKNGRRKDEARNELNVFLDDDSDSFVSWLWDHLGSNLNLYVQPQQPHPDVVLKKNPVTVECAGGDSQQMESESKTKPDKPLKSRQSREWKGLEIDKGKRPSLQSIVNDGIHTNRESPKVGQETRSISPQSVVRRKRNRAEERQQVKREAVSQASIAAPRRLLQFAVRDAVATSKPSNSTSEPSSKRLRSVVSTSAEDLNLQEQPQKIRPVARLPNAVERAIKAVAEAAEDVRRARSSSNVFDRLGRRGVISETVNQLSEFGDDPGDSGEDGTYNDPKEQGGLSYDQRNDYSRPNASDVSALHRNTRMVIDPALVDNDYNTNVTSRVVMGVAHTGTSGGNRGESSPLIQHSMASNAEKLNLRGSLGVDDQKLVEVNEALTSQSGMLVMKDNSNPVLVANGNAKFEVDLQKESQKNLLSVPGLYPTGGETEDADSRTIYVNNVHFAATKDGLSRHFNKSGAVVKVVILTDTATGQPKGSAYIEFMSKEAAENALSLDGTSFMSRILRVVRKSSAQLEASSITPWPRVVRASPYTVSRFGRPPFPRGSPGAYRSRFPGKPGARSFQWKRETQSTPSETSITASGNTGPSSIPRSLTYIRTEAKSNGS